MPNLRISELTELTASAGDEYVELIVPPYTAGTNRKILSANFVGATREFNRAFVETLVFDKNEIFHEPITMTDDIVLEIGAGGLVDQSSAMRFRITADGIHSISFGLGFDFLYGITNGQILDAGTYEIYFLYTNGSVSVSVPGVSAQTSGATTLTAPTNFAAVDDGETAIDLSWDNVTSNQGYLIQFSLNGTSGWSDLETTAQDATTSTQTSLNAGDIRYYRIRTLGDGVITLNSSYSSVISGQTQASGDITDPTFTFLPVNGNNTWPINKPITITANEPIRNTDGSTLTDANIAAVLILKETNSGGTNIAFTATIDATKQIITIYPTTIYGVTQIVYVAINNVEDVNNNEVTSAQSITFTTTDFTYFNGLTNFMAFGDILDTLWTADNTKFKLQLTLNDPILTGTKFLAGKYSTGDNQRAFYWYATGPDISFAWCKVGTSINRAFRWPAALITGDHDYELAYDGSLNTNNGADRLTLKRDGSTVGGKEAEFTALSIGDIVNTTAQLSIGTGVNAAGAAAFSLFYGYEAKDFKVLSGGSDVVEINVPILRTGTDTSGNARNGTWV